MINLEYKLLENFQSALVIGGGISIKRYDKQISELSKKSEFVVIACNYYHPNFKVNYTFFTDHIKFIENITKFHKKNIIITSNLVKYAKKYKKNKYFIVGQNSFPRVYISNKINITENGLIMHKDIGSAGFGALLLSTFFKPQKIIAVGFDGFSTDWSYKLNLYGERLQNERKKRNNVRKFKYLDRILIPYIKNCKINIYSFPCDTFWGINKKKHKILEFNNLEI